MAFPRSSPRLLLALLAIGLALLLPARSHAATVPTFSPERLTDCGGWRGGGQRDAAGNLYLPCATDAVLRRPSIRIYAPDGSLARSVAVPTIPGGSRSDLTDVAPSPDGRYLYAAQDATKNYVRFVRQADGSYAFDAGFRFGQFAYGVMKDPHGEFIATDGRGEVYIANGTWVPGAFAAPTIVLHYAADGTYLGRFGEYAGGSRTLGDFYWMLGDLAPTPDGMSVYTTEVGNNRVQRWDRNFDGSFTARVAYGNTAADDQADDPNQAGDQSRTTVCDQPGKFGAPYATALDTANNVYVMSTNCWLGGKTQIGRLDIATGTWSIINGPKYGNNQSHELAIDARGDIFMASVDTTLRATGVAPAPVPVPPLPTPQPAADVTAPELSSATLPATTAARTVTLALAATDAVGVTQLRMAQAGADITAAPWVAYAAQVSVELGAADGPTTVRVQVRDAAGNLSAVLAATTIYTAPVVVPPVVVPPVVVPPVVAPPVVVPPVVAPPKANQAPVLNEVTLPNPAVTQAITVSIDAADDTAVTEMRLATEEGDWGGWTKFDAAASFTLTAGNGARGVFVQVRDAEHLESRSLYRTTVAAVPAVVVPPVAVPPVVVPPVVAPPVVAPPVVVPPVVVPPVVVPPVVVPPVVVPPVVVPPVVAPPVRDTKAPVLEELTLPKTIATRTVTVSTKASDNVAVTRMRLASDNGVWQPWQDYAAATPWTVAPTAMVKGVFVQVRDAAGNESNVKYLTTLCTPCLPAPQARALAHRTRSLATRRLRTGSARLELVRASALGHDFDLSQDDHRRDVLDCGGGFDTALVRPGDVTRHCERVVVVRSPTIAPPT
ncbi:MAG: hypothetical protein JWN72_2300 [Thermoleophilia bacterium]|nr:hypothetical protein [Thermoleophilia bacterium]